MLLGWRLSLLSRLEAIATTRMEAIASRKEAIATRMEAIASRMASRLETIGSRLEAISSDFHGKRATKPRATSI